MVYVTFLPLSMRHQATVRDVPDLTYFTSPLLEQTHSYTHLYLVVQLHGINSQRSKLL